MASRAAPQRVSLPPAPPELLAIVRALARAQADEDDAVATRAREQRDMDELIEEFAALAPDGRIVTLLVYQEWIGAGTFKNPDAKVRGLKRIETDDGDMVNFVDENTFTLVATRETLHRRDRR